MNDDADFHPPDPSDVARRAAIIKYQLVYLAATPPPDVVFELGANQPVNDRIDTDDHLEERQRRVIAALRGSGLWEDTSPTERALFAQPVTAITERQVIDGSWRAESLHCLAWALGLVDEIPDYDTLTDPDILLPLISTADVADFCRSATLRAPNLIDEAREIAELWHWRSRTRQLQEDGYTPGPGEPSLDAIVRELAPRMVASGNLPATIDDDFPVLGQAYRDLSNEQWATARSIAMERHLALNWLCGYAPGNEWDETPTDT
jgi:hypothetical protein